MNSRIYKWTFWLLAAFAGLHWLGTRWGATDAEVDANLPGDDVIPHPNFETTHAVSVAAPPATIWPWIAQGGYGRGGWYSESWLDPIIIGALVVMTPAGKPKPTRPPRSAAIRRRWACLTASALSWAVPSAAGTSRHRA